TAETIDAYMKAWNEPDESKRRALLDACWADDGVYIDPLSDVRGREGLNGAIAGMHAQSAGASIVLASGIDQHHNQVRFKWEFRQTDGKTAIAGIDVGELASDGRLARIVGFWAEPPTA
ncbi:MAG TPA: nuclear transport factor 2 family protein, partial [Dehalococcoidia bacterium]